MQHLIMISEVMALVAALWLGRGIRNEGLQSLKILLGMIVFVECASLVNTGFRLNLFNAAKWYNFFIPVEFCVYFYIFHQVAKNRRWKIFIRIAAILFALTAAAGLTILHISYFNTWLYSGGVLLLSAVCLQYIYRSITGNDILTISGNLLFYIASGIVLFYLGTLPYHAMRNQLYDHYPKIFWVYYYLFIVLDCLMYFLFMLGFYQFRRTYFKKQARYE